MPEGTKKEFARLKGGFCMHTKKVLHAQMSMIAGMRFPGMPEGTKESFVRMNTGF